jgi:hypothetical protein
MARRQRLLRTIIYGRTYKTLSSKSETLGEAFCVLFDIADNEKSKK